MFVNEYLETTAEKLPDKVALVCEHQRLTYREINHAANQLAYELMRLGIEHQDRIAVFIENSIEAVISIFGILKAGAVFMVLNPSMKYRKLKYILDDSGAKILITNSKKIDIIKNATLNNYSLSDIFWVGENDASENKDIVAASHKWNDMLSAKSDLTRQRGVKDLAQPSISHKDLAAIIYTSGSTGKPKGVMSNHYNIVSAANSIVQYLENVQTDIILNVLPLHFDYGLYQVLMTFLFGGTLVLEKSFAYPYKILKRIVEEKITGFPIVPTIAGMLNQIRNWEDFHVNTIRYITSTGDVLSEANIINLQKMFPKAKIFSMYGLTECKRVSYLPPEDLNEKPKSVGIPIPNVDASIVNKDGQQVKVGEIGELVISGPNVMQGYWNDENETNRVFRENPKNGEKLLYTGDLFRKDIDGYLYFVARKDEIIKIKDHRVNPVEVADILCELDVIDESFAFGSRDENGSCTITAVIVPCKGVRPNIETILNYCRQNLEPFMVPNHIEFRKKMPKLPNGKINKKELILVSNNH